MTRPAAAFILAHTVPAPVPLVPELRLHLATEITPLWQATQAWLDAHDLPPPFWAFPWAGGQALARHVLDQPGIVAGRRVLDFAAGSGLVGLAAARAGAAEVRAVDIDPFATAACTLNADLNALTLQADCADRVGDQLAGVEVILAGDVCYEGPMAARVMGWLRALATDGRTVLVGDPGRAYLPDHGMEQVGSFDVPTSLELEDAPLRAAGVWRVLPGGRG